MKCAYRYVQAQEKRKEAYNEITDEFIQFLDASAGCVMHDLFGSGQNRLFDMYAGMHESVSGAMEENPLADGEIGEDAPESVKAIMERLKRNPKSEATLAVEAVEEYKDKLLECGFDMDAEAAEVPVIDKFGCFGMQKHEANHEVRLVFLENFWVIVQMYHGALLLWLRKRRGFGEIRLRRTYRALLSDWREYCGEYLRCTVSGDRAARAMTEERQARCGKIGIEFEK